MCEVKHASSYIFRLNCSFGQSCLTRLVYPKSGLDQFITSDLVVSIFMMLESSYTYFDRVAYCRPFDLFVLITAADPLDALDWLRQQLRRRPLALLL